MKKDTIKTEVKVKDNIIGVIRFGDLGEVLINPFTKK